MYKKLRLVESSLTEGITHKCLACGKVIPGFSDEEFCKDCTNNLSDEEKEKAREDLLSNGSLTEAPDEEDLEDIKDDAEEELENEEDLKDTIDSEEEQEENPVEEETELDKELNELREVLVDLDLNLYQITSKEDTKDCVYIIGKVAEDSNDTLMLIDTKPEEVNSEDNEEDKPIADNIAESDEESEEELENEEDKTELEERFDFVKLPLSYEEINRLNPRYGEDLTPDHEAIMEYLMNCLIEQNPEAAEELQRNKENSDDTSVEPENVDLDIDIEGEEETEDEE